MHKLSKEEAVAIKRQSGSVVPFKQDILDLETGEVLCIPADEWPKKTPPAGYYHSIFNKPAKTIAISKLGDNYYIEKL
ncbi:MAG: hypothetical protein JST83_05420 [Bacteroidetes bacterium]|nr:hypothetical protein [Bacteroidota bacterium]